MSLVRHSPVDEDSPDNHSHKITYQDAYIPTLAQVTFRPSIVRFCLPPTPPQATEMPPNPTPHRVVGTKDPSVTDVPKLHQSASKWTKADLSLLGVDYQYDQFDNIPSRIGIEDANVPPELFGSNNPFMTF
jgi:hypothetical protein